MNNVMSSAKSIPVSVKNHKHPLLAIQQELDRAIDSLNRWFEPTFFSERFEDLTLFPAMDIVDDKEHFKIEVEMPGMGEEDVKVSINEGVLTIKGEKNTSKQDQNKNYLMREISYGSYVRSVALPNSVDANKAKASFKKGMLWVDIPKKTEAIQQSHDIKVEKAS